MFSPNAVVAASMMPIVIAMLRFTGIEDGRARSPGLADRGKHRCRRSGTPMGGPNC
jgi:hypothetical protein